MKKTVLITSMILIATSGWSQGLKKVDYQNAETSVQNPGAEAAAPQLSPEQVKMMMDTVKRAREAQEAQAKFLEELDAED